MAATLLQPFVSEENHWTVSETLPISEFEPMVRHVFARPRNGVYKAAMDKNQAAR
ncbi:HD phosphohydrolase-like protein [Cupriavidus basilensis OR16]|uniref:HD phosphohydrolase-like protein n=1 Tax=Cupriavidus basilensis OR16 TaxID=1127483 RepID=H1S839_9BURK|nr:hypothetical protein [Cupriavidus basilensis]EHP41308.1 HD phosphohydrolase-like protein [Cupriavidus basilensis OR16]